MLALLALSPIVITVVTVFAGSDARGDATAAARRWERALERFWAVLVLDFTQSVIYIATNVGMNYAFATGGSAIQGFMLSALSILTLGLLAYSEVYAAIEPAPSTLLLVPMACVRSLVLALGSPNRALLLVFLTMALSGLVAAIPGAAEIRFATQTAVALFLEIPLAALTVTFYLDVLARESARDAAA